MSLLLIFHTSLNPVGSVTRELTSAFTAQYISAHPGTTSIERDLAAEPIPHLSPDLVSIQLGAAPASSNASQLPSLALADTLIDELERADALVMGVPMYNFTIPSTLKAWLDHVIRARRTFDYVDGVPKGLLPPGKKVIVFVASGGAYTESAVKAFDFIEPYLRAVFGFVGVTDITIIRAEKQAWPGAAVPERIGAMQRASELALSL